MRFTLVILSTLLTLSLSVPFQSSSLSLAPRGDTDPAAPKPDIPKKTKLGFKSKLQDLNIFESQISRDIRHHYERLARERKQRQREVDAAYDRAIKAASAGSKSQPSFLYHMKEQRKKAHSDKKGLAKSHRASSSDASDAVQGKYQNAGKKKTKGEEETKKLREARRKAREGKAMLEEEGRKEREKLKKQAKKGATFDKRALSSSFGGYPGDVKTDVSSSTIQVRSEGSEKEKTKQQDKTAAKLQRKARKRIEKQFRKYVKKQQKEKGESSFSQAPPGWRLNMGANLDKRNLWDSMMTSTSNAYDKAKSRMSESHDQRKQRKAKEMQEKEARKAQKNEEKSNDLGMSQMPLEELTKRTNLDKREVVSSFKAHTAAAFDAVKQRYKADEEERLQWKANAKLERESRREARKEKARLKKKAKKQKAKLKKQAKGMTNLDKRGLPSVFRLHAMNAFDKAKGRSRVPKKEWDDLMNQAKKEDDLGKAKAKLKKEAEKLKKKFKKGAKEGTNLDKRGLGSFLRFHTMDAIAKVKGTHRVPKKEWDEFRKQLKKEKKAKAKLRKQAEKMKKKSKKGAKKGKKLNKRESWQKEGEEGVTLGKRGWASSLKSMYSKVLDKATTRPWETEQQTAVRKAKGRLKNFVTKEKKEQKKLQREKMKQEYLKKKQEEKNAAWQKEVDEWRGVSKREAWQKEGEERTTLGKRGWASSLKSMYSKVLDKATTRPWETEQQTAVRKAKGRLKNFVTKEKKEQKRLQREKMKQEYLLKKQAEKNAAWQKEVDEWRGVSKRGLMEFTKAAHSKIWNKITGRSRATKEKGGRLLKPGEKKSGPLPDERDLKEARRLDKMEKKERLRLEKEEEKKNREISKRKKKEDRELFRHLIKNPRLAKRGQLRYMRDAFRDATGMYPEDDSEYDEKRKERDARIAKKKADKEFAAKQKKKEREAKIAKKKADKEFAAQQKKKAKENGVGARMWNSMKTSTSNAVGTVRSTLFKSKDENKAKEEWLKQRAKHVKQYEAHGKKMSQSTGPPSGLDKRGIRDSMKALAIQAMDKVKNKLAESKVERKKRKALERTQKKQKKARAKAKKAAAKAQAKPDQGFPNHPPKKERDGGASSGHGTWQSTPTFGLDKRGLGSYMKKVKNRMMESKLERKERKERKAKAKLEKSAQKTLRDQQYKDWRNERRITNHFDKAFNPQRHQQRLQRNQERRVVHSDRSSLHQDDKAWTGMGWWMNMYKRGLGDSKQSSNSNAMDEFKGRSSQSDNEKRAKKVKKEKAKREKENEKGRKEIEMVESRYDADVPSWSEKSLLELQNEHPKKRATLDSRDKHPKKKTALDKRGQIQSSTLNSRDKIKGTYLKIKDRGLERRATNKVQEKKEKKENELKLLETWYPKSEMNMKKGRWQSIRDSTSNAISKFIGRPTESKQKKEDARWLEKARSAREKAHKESWQSLKRKQRQLAKESSHADRMFRDAHIEYMKQKGIIKKRGIGSSIHREYEKLGKKEKKLEKEAQKQKNKENELRYMKFWYSKTTFDMKKKGRWESIKDSTSNAIDKLTGKSSESIKKKEEERENARWLKKARKAHANSQMEYSPSARRMGKKGAKLLREQEYRDWADHMTGVRNEGINVKRGLGHSRYSQYEELGKKEKELEKEAQKQKKKEDELEFMKFFYPKSKFDLEKKGRWESIKDSSSNAINKLKGKPSESDQEKEDARWLKKARKAHANSHRERSHSARRMGKKREKIWREKQYRDWADHMELVRNEGINVKRGLGDSVHSRYEELGKKEKKEQARLQREAWSKEKEEEARSYMEAWEKDKKEEELHLLKTLYPKSGMNMEKGRWRSIKDSTSNAIGKLTGKSSESIKKKEEERENARWLKKAKKAHAKSKEEGSQSQREQAKGKTWKEWDSYITNLKDEGRIRKRGLGHSRYIPFEEFAKKEKKEQARLEKEALKRRKKEDELYMLKLLYPKSRLDMEKKGRWETAKDSTLNAISKFTGRPSKSKEKNEARIKEEDEEKRWLKKARRAHAKSIKESIRAIEREEARKPWELPGPPLGRFKKRGLSDSMKAATSNAMDKMKGMVSESEEKKRAKKEKKLKDEYEKTWKTLNSEDELELLEEWYPKSKMNKEKGRWRSIKDSTSNTIDKLTGKSSESIRKKEEERENARWLKQARKARAKLEKKSRQPKWSEATRLYRELWNAPKDVRNAHYAHLKDQGKLQKRGGWGSKKASASNAMDKLKGKASESDDEKKARKERKAQAKQEKKESKARAKEEKQAKKAQAKADGRSELERQLSATRKAIYGAHSAAIEYQSRLEKRGVWGSIKTSASNAMDKIKGKAPENEDERKARKEREAKAKQEKKESKAKAIQEKNEIKAKAKQEKNEIKAKAKQEKDEIKAKAKQEKKEKKARAKEASRRTLAQEIAEARMAIWHTQNAILDFQGRYELSELEKSALDKRDRWGAIKTSASNAINRMRGKAPESEAERKSRKESEKAKAEAKKKAKKEKAEVKKKAKKEKAELKMKAKEEKAALKKKAKEEKADLKEKAKEAKMLKEHEEFRKKQTELFRFVAENVFR